MSSDEKMKFIGLIEGCELSISEALTRYNIPCSTCCRLKRKYELDLIVRDFPFAIKNVNLAHYNTSFGEAIEAPTDKRVDKHIRLS